MASFTAIDTSYILKDIQSEAFLRHKFSLPLDVAELFAALNRNFEKKAGFRLSQDRAASAEGTFVAFETLVSSAMEASNLAERSGAPQGVSKPAQGQLRLGRLLPSRSARPVVCF